MALFRSMITPTTNPTLQRTVLLTALLLAIVASGFSKIEVHSHSDAYFGHVHDLHGNDELDGENSADLDESGNTGVMHVHDTGTTPLTLVSTINVDVTTFRRVGGGALPPIVKPPDILIPPLYRPPIV